MAHKLLELEPATLFKFPTQSGWCSTPFSGYFFRDQACGWRVKAGQLTIARSVGGAGASGCGRVLSLYVRWSGVVSPHANPTTSSCPAANPPCNGNDFDVCLVGPLRAFNAKDNGHLHAAVTRIRRVLCQRCVSWCVCFECSGSVF